jgi:signal transduction histidine kinase/CheY-like chemotaxis protein
MSETNSDSIGQARIQVFRSQALDKSMFIALIGGLLLLALSMLRMLETGWLSFMSLHILSIIVLLGLFLSRRHLSYSFLAISLTFIIYLIPLASIINFGEFGSGRQLFWVVVFFSYLMLGRKAGISAILIIIATAVFVKLLDLSGYVEPYPLTPGRIEAISSWFLPLGGLFIGVFACGKATRFLMRKIGEALLMAEQRNASLLTEIQQREALEEQVRQGQKMETTGQLTGGIAHDFNNLLAIISGNVEELRIKPNPSDEKRLAVIARAVARGAALTHRLLTFSRRQKLEPITIDVPLLMGEFNELLRRTLGREIDIVIKADADTWPIRADVSQLENVLLNLAINARDAMTAGGTLTISSENAYMTEQTMRNGERLAAGDYVRITLRDTGTGIPAEIMSRVFEPFFTTKGVGGGGGMGLGLSMVYGFARQSNGDVTISSEVGKGTEFSLLLPHDQHVQTTGSAPMTVEKKHPVNSLRYVAVVEDTDPKIKADAMPGNTIDRGSLESLPDEQETPPSAPVAVEMVSSVAGADAASNQTIQHRLQSNLERLADKINLIILILSVLTLIIALYSIPERGWSSAIIGLHFVTVVTMFGLVVWRRHLSFFLKASSPSIVLSIFAIFSIFNIGPFGPAWVLFAFGAFLSLLMFGWASSLTVLVTAAVATISSFLLHSSGYLTPLTVDVLTFSTSPLTKVLVLLAGSWIIGFATDTLLKNLSVALSEEEQKSILLSAEIEQREKLEEQVRQGQKMAAIGQLTGGIAHDFNNLLAVISGNVEELRINPSPSDEKRLAVIARSVARGSALTHQLLAFSRLQKLNPVTIDVPLLIREFNELLGRTLGREIDIVIKADADTWPIRADVSQLENVLLNLAINARDAMTTGGTLAISSENTYMAEQTMQNGEQLTAGDYVRITLRDTGTGMPAEIVSRVFEPFFTTKGVGGGTGLGLSMVYGFARQSSGDVIVNSEVGGGTAFNLFFPRDHDHAQATESVPPLDEIQRGEGQTVLILEDDSDFCETLSFMVEELGYRTVEAADAAEATAILEGPSGGGVDVILSDVILPGDTDGFQFIDSVKRIYPGIKVVMMSGYTFDRASKTPMLEAAVPMLEKPFSRSDLAHSLHRALEN